MRCEQAPVGRVSGANEALPNERRNPTYEKQNYMKTLRRYDIRENLYFITVVTLNREKILLNNITFFWDSWGTIPLYAWVILPDHFHMVIDVGTKGISDILHDFKIKYSWRYRPYHGTGKIWQNRFWDHILRDLDDLNRHLDYIHYNPVKHGLVKGPCLYEHSSFRKYLAEDFYPVGWGMTEDLVEKGDFGE